MKNKHRIKQGLSLLLAGGIALTNLGAALPAFAEDAAATPETASAATPETAEANVPTPNLSQITENLYNDLPDAPTGSYLGSMGLPVATGETKIGISAWVSDLYDGVDAHMDADALNADENTVTIGKTPGTDYAIVPLLAQVEYPADGAISEIILPDGVELLSYRSTDYEPIPADEQEQTEILHQTYSEQSAAATGLYVKASADFTAQLVYTDSDGSSQSKSIHVQISEDAAPTQMYADTGDDGIAAYAAGPTPPYTTGKITSIAKEGGTWLIWFNGQEAYCCSHGLNGQPKGCPTYSFSHVSRLEPGQYTPGNHYANQVNIWGGLGQLSLDMLDDRPVVASLEDDPEGCEEQPDILGSLYDETQQWIMENYPDSYAAQTYIAAAEELINGTDAQSEENGYYTYIYNPPAGYAWQVVALVGEEIAGGTEIPDVPSVPEPKYYSAAWTAPAQSASGSFDLTFTVNTDKYQLNTLEKVDGAVITVTPSRTGGNVDGGSWQMSPAGAQTITTSGHTQDDNFHLNGGDGSATWTVHYEVSKTSTSTLSGQEGPFTSQAEADAAAEAAKNAAIGQLQNEAQGMVDAAIAAARAQLANITFAYDEITIPHGFDSTPGALGSHQTITVPANSSNDYPMKNDEWSVKVSIDKIDSETKQRIKGDAEFKIFAWDIVRQCYIPNGGYNLYKVERQSNGTYKVINHSDYAGGSDDLFYTQRNEGKFVIVESRAPNGYYGDWTDVTKPGTAGSVLGKRAYAFEITKALDGQTIWLGNADYNADITTANSGGTLIDTGEGVVTITFGSRNADKTYATDPTGIANNEDSYTMHANADKMQNDRVLGNILLTKVDLDAARYLAAGSNGDTTLEGAVYDLYAADTIEHPDGVSGVVDYSKITDANGTPIWHTTVLTNGGWDTDYLPILQKDRLVASAKITDGKLAFANLYMGRYYLVERATGLVLPIDGNGKLYVTGKYPQLNKKLERTGKYSSLATKGGEYTDYIYKNQYSAVAESRKLNGSKAWDGYYLSYAKGYLCDEVNHYKTLSYADESTYHIHAEQESQDEVLKSGFSLQKLVSTTGQPSPALKLEGAGFTVYRISKLSKAAHFKQNPDGSYDAVSILSAYRKDNYDNATLKKSHYVPEDEWTIFENTHEPIIDQQTFDLVQKIRGNVRRYPDGWGEAAPLTGLLYCADCGGKMYVHRTNNGKRISQYTCSQYSKVPVGKLCTTQHRINEDVVLSLVSEMLKAIAEYAKHDRAEFVRVVQEAQSSQQTAEVKKQRTRLATAKQRVSELEVLLCKIYEDNILGKLSDSRYATLDAQYAKEQAELTAEISALEKAVKSYETHEKDADRFIALIDKYENFDKLTIAMLNEFIEKILVHERDRKGSIQTTQEVEIYFNFVGRFVPPAFGEVELTLEELEEIRKREERKDRLHQNYLKRKASGAQKRYEDKIKERKKTEIEAKKAAIRAEDIAKGVFVPVSSLPQREPMKGVQTA